MEFSRCARAELAQREIAGRCFSTAGPVSQNSTAKRLDVEVDVDLGGAGLGRVNGIDEADSTPGVSAPEIPRREVIQPQLPIRLPCYDFTPIIDLTIDSCLPCR